VKGENSSWDGTGKREEIKKSKEKGNYHEPALALRREGENTDGV